MPFSDTSPQYDNPLSSYKPLAWQAVIALVCGLLSPLAFVSWRFGAASVLGAMFAIWALRREGVAGRGLATIGLVISLLFLAAAPSYRLAHRRLICREARQFAELWLRDLAENRPEIAFQLLRYYPKRPPLDDRLWNYYRTNDVERTGLEDFAAEPAIRTLLALGRNAKARCYEISGTGMWGESDTVSLCSAITYDDADGPKSFFLRLNLIRSSVSDAKADWRVYEYIAGIRPAGWRD